MWEGNWWFRTIMSTKGGLVFLVQMGNMGMPWRYKYWKSSIQPKQWDQSQCIFHTWSSWGGHFSPQSHLKALTNSFMPKFAGNWVIEVLWNYLLPWEWSFVTMTFFPHLDFLTLLGEDPKSYSWEVEEPCITTCGIEKTNSHVVGLAGRNVAWTIMVG